MPIYICNNCRGEPSTASTASCDSVNCVYYLNYNSLCVVAITLHSVNWSYGPILKKKSVPEIEVIEKCQK